MAKIENVCINIKVGKKEYHLKNLILDVYLNRYATSLLQEKNRGIKKQSACFIKFDTPIENVTSKSRICNKEFDLGIGWASILEEISHNKVTIKYNWNNETTLKYSQGVLPDWANYVSRKICMLGFNYSPGPNVQISSILDLSNYDIYVEEGQDIYITRVDTITTDAIFTSSDIKQVKGPLHLAVDEIKGLLDSSGKAIDISYIKIAEVGLSNNPKEIQRKFDLDYEVIGNVFKIKNLYSPVGVYPSDNLYPSNNLYPDDIPYDYLVLKFVLYQDMDNGTYETPDIVETDTGEWYLQAIPLRKNGKIDLNIKYERG